MTPHLAQEPGYVIPNELDTERDVFKTYVQVHRSAALSRPPVPVSWADVFDLIDLEDNSRLLSAYYTKRWNDWLEFTKRALKLVDEKGFVFNPDTKKLDGNWNGDAVCLCFYSLIRLLLTHFRLVLRSAICTTFNFPTFRL